VPAGPQAGEVVITTISDFPGRPGHVAAIGAARATGPSSGHTRHGGMVRSGRPRALT